MPFLSDETRCLCSGTLSTPSGRYYWTNPIITLNSSGTATGPALLSLEGMVGSGGFVRSFLIADPRGLISSVAEHSLVVRVTRVRFSYWTLLRGTLNFPSPDDPRSSSPDHHFLTGYRRYSL